MVNKTYYHTIVVVLVYRNIDIVKDFFQSLNLKSHKVIIVNSYYDDASLEECRIIANQYGADFIPIENKGYGYGNNVGVQHAMNNYEYDFLIISNSDIEIKKMPHLDQYSGGEYIIAPKTIMRTGKHQNPSTPWEMPFLYPILSFAHRRRSPIVCTCCHICTRLAREIFRIYAFIIRKKEYKIFSAHGSFIIFTKRAINKLFPIFDDEMFLYNEEWFLALKAKKYNVPVVFIPDIEVFHYEGASSDFNVYSEYDKQSFEILNYKRINDLI